MDVDDLSFVVKDDKPRVMYDASRAVNFANRHMLKAYVAVRVFNATQKFDDMLTEQAVNQYMKYSCETNDFEEMVRTCTVIAIKKINRMYLAKPIRGAIALHEQAQWYGWQSVPSFRDLLTLNSRLF